MAVRLPATMTLRDMVTPSDSVDGDSRRIDARPWRDAASASIVRDGPWELSSRTMSEILDAVRAGASAEALAATPMPATTRAVFVRRDEQDDVRRHGQQGQGPAREPARRRGRRARTRARRGLRRGHGVVDQLQHRVDEHLRAAADVRVPRPSRPRSRTGASATRWTTTSSARTPRASSCASGRRCATGRSATRSRCTATTSTTRTPARTTTRCWRATSASGGSRRTSAASPTSASSRPTS